MPTSEKTAEYEAARMFFLDLIAAEAANEGQPLSSAEKSYLYAIGAAEDEKYREALRELDRVGNSDALVLRASELLKRAVDRDVANDPAATARYAARLNAVSDTDFLLWTIVYAGVRRQSANRVGRVLQVSFIVAGITVLWIIVLLIINVIRHR